MMMMMNMILSTLTNVLKLSLRFLIRHYLSGGGRSTPKVLTLVIREMIWAARWRMRWRTHRRMMVILNRQCGGISVVFHKNRSSIRYIWNGTTPILPHMFHFWDPDVWITTCPEWVILKITHRGDCWIIDYHPSMLWLFLISRRYCILLHTFVFWNHNRLTWIWPTNILAQPRGGNYHFHTRF